ncbi:dihydroxy-acid dehydratase domain-containing protein, partial [Limibacillus halophilus]
LMEIMGLHLPGASFVNPGTPLRSALTAAATKRAAEITALGNDFRPVGKLIDEKAVVNGIVGLLATGGSTNHTLHLVAMAAAAGHRVTWDDFAELSAVVPLLARIYPNGLADVNHFQAAGGMACLIAELRKAGLLHDEVSTVAGEGLEAYTKEPGLEDGRLIYRDGPASSHDEKVLRPASQPFSADGGLKMLSGNLGRAVIKVSAVKPDHRVVEAPCRIFYDQNDLAAAFKAGELYRDLIAVVLFQGPKANGMPELHKLTPSLGVLQDRGHKVALVTDGRMSGASGKVPAAIHVTPEAEAGGPLACLRDGDLVRLDADAGTLEALVPQEVWEKREPLTRDLSSYHQGMGRELFSAFRSQVSGAAEGATVFPFFDAARP